MSDLKRRPSGGDCSAATAGIAKRQPRRASAGAKARSRSGCLTCKTKHIKCDETRPSCQACMRKGLECGGYSRELKWSYKHQPGTIDLFVDHFADAARNSTRPGSRSPLQRRNQGHGVPETGSVSPLSPLSSLPFDMTDDMNDTLSLGLFDAVPGWDELAQPRRQSFNAIPSPGPSASPRSPKSVILELQESTPDASLEAARTLLQVSPIASGPDTTLVLISSWFDQVSPAWSGFDSGVNLNRKLASDLWSNSAAVFNSLQSMSASFLSARLPQMRKPALTLMKTATQCIQAEVSAFHSQTRLDCIPTGLLFSLFCLGTTVCWLDSSRLGIPFLLEARSVIQRLGLQFQASTTEDRELIAFFKKSLVYWEMLLAVAGEDNSELSLPLGAIGTNNRIGPAPASDDESAVDHFSHPWTGISTHTSGLFTRSIRLCRGFRANIARHTGTVRNAASTLQYIQEAQRLEEQLLELDFNNTPQAGDTRTDPTQLSQIARMAEAYQLSSLLLLYETFPDLVSLRLPFDSALADDGIVPWEKWVIPLTLRLIDILQDIPIDSPSRVMQPLLYICASTGLRYTSTDASPLYTTSRQGDGVIPNGFGGSSHAGSDLFEYIRQMESSEITSHEPSPVSPMAVSISNARNFVMKRLNILESTLQPKPVMVAKELVKAVWAAYDSEGPGVASIHWLDVMENGELRSLFG